MMKRIAIFTILILSVTIASVSAATKPGQADVGLLQTLGLIKDDELEIDSDTLVTRAEFLEKILNVTKLSDSVSSDYIKPLFSDVPEKHYYHKTIVDAYNLGIINGYANGTFEPDSPITLAQAYRIILNCLGYSMKLDIIGNSESSCYNIAREQNLNYNISLAMSEPLKRSDMIQLIFNTLHAQCFEIDFSSSGYKEGKTLLESRYDINFDEGVVEADNYTTITNSLAAENKIKINGKSYISQDIGLVGYRVREYYSSESNDNTGIYTIKEDNKEISVLHKDFIGCNLAGGYIEYSDTNDRIKRIRVKASTTSFLYNGVILTSNIVIESKLKSVCTRILAIDNDNDDLYDVVYIEQYSNIFLTQIDSITKSLYGRNNEKIDFINDYEKYLIVDDNNSRIDIDELSKNCVLTVCYPDDKKDTIKIYVSKKSNLVSIKEKSDEKIIDNEGETFYISESCVSNFNDLLFGSSVTIYFDFFGNATYFEQEKSDFAVGYIIKLRYNRKEDNYELKMLTKENGVFTYNLAEKIRLRLADGTTDKKRAQETYDYIKDNDFINKPIWYRKNEAGEIREIWFLTTIQSLEFHEVTSSAMFSDITASEYNSLFIYKNTMGFMAKLMFRNSSSDVFVVPKDDTGYGGDQDYKVTSPSFFKQNDRFDCSATGNYKPTAICFSKNGFLTDALIWEINYNASISDYGRGYVGIVTKIATIYDEQSEEICYELTVVNKSGTQTKEKYFITGTDVVDSNNRKIEAGDVICYGKDPAGYLKSGTVTLCYDASTEIMYCTMIGQNYYRWDMNRISTAQVLAKDDDYIQVQLVKNFDGSGTSIECYKIKSTSVYSYDKSSRTLKSQSPNRVGVGDKFMVLLSGGTNVDMIVYYE